MGTDTLDNAPVHFSRRSRRLQPGAGLRAAREADASTIPLFNPEAKERLCLKCRRPFLSTWAGHRLCMSCRIRNLEIGTPHSIAPPRLDEDDMGLDE